MNLFFFGSLILYFIATVLQFIAAAMHKDKVHTVARIAYLTGFAAHTVCTVWRGISAQRIPLANQFEFASGFAWATVVMGFIVYRRLNQQWVLTAAMPVSFLVLSYAAFQPMQIKDIMPALRSTWFALHIGSAAFSYASFAISAALGALYLVRLGKGQDEQDVRMRQIDYLGYRLVCLVFLLLTVVIFSGAIWAEQAWSSWWSWDPKETWALITWIFYATYLHQRLRKKWRGKKTAVMSIVAFVLVLFTFAGVNLILPGLHSYA